MANRMTKTALLRAINAHLTAVSRLDDPPLAYIDGLNQFKRKVGESSGVQLSALVASWLDLGIEMKAEQT